MDHDELMLYIKNHPDCTSMEIAAYFGTTVAKAFTYCNEMITLGLLYKTRVKSQDYNKYIFGYRTIPAYNEIMDNSDGSIRAGEAYSILRRCKKVHGNTKAYKRLDSMNEWRLYHNVPLLRKELI